MIYSFDDLQIKYSNYTNIKDKIRREVRAGYLIPITRGLYETDTATDGKYLAGRIYGPSYLSFDYALYVYSLIPEAVYKTYTSATFNKRKAKKYQNHFGIFTYRDIPAAVYPLGVLKVHAVICRAWKNRVKGRDLYDYVFYLANQAEIYLPHLRARLEDTGVLRESDIFTIDTLKTMLTERFDTIDYEQAKQDVLPFIQNPDKLNLWSKDFFMSITENLQS